MGTTYGHRIVTDGLVLHLDAANTKSYPGTGTVWTDLSGNNNNGSLQNGVNYDSADLGSLEFDGVDDFIDCGQVLTASKYVPLTLEAWVKPTGGSGTWRTIIGTHGSYAQITISSGNSFYMGQNAGGGWWLGSGVTALLDTWYHVVGVYTGTQAIIYVDGVLKNGPDTYSFSNNHGVSLIGSYKSSGGERFNGQIANAKIYNRVLSQAEVTQNFNALKGRYGL